MTPLATASASHTIDVVSMTASTPVSPAAVHLTQTIGLVLFVVSVLGIYFTACAVWPFTKCRRCDGIGRHHSPGRAYWRDCTRCRGTGATVRLGRRLYTRARGLHRDGTRPLNHNDHLNGGRR